MRWIAIMVFLLAGATSSRADPPLVQLDTGGHMALIKGLAFTPDGKFIVSAGDDKVIRIWDWRAGKTVRTIRGLSGTGKDGQLYALAISPDGRLLAVGGRTRGETENGFDIRLYDFASGEQKARLSGHSAAINTLAFSPDGKKLISGGIDGDAIIWDVETKALLSRLPGHRAEIYGAAFTPDGLRAATASFDKTLRLWSVADGALLKEMTGHGDKIRSFAVSSKGDIFSGDNQGEIRQWNGATGALKRVLARNPRNVASLSVSPDGRLVFSGAGGYGAGDFGCFVYDAESGRRITKFNRHDNIVLASAFSPDGGLVASAGGHHLPIYVWDAKTGETKAVLKGTGLSAWAVGFSADGRGIAWGNTERQVSGTVRGPLEASLRLPSVGEVLPQPEPLAKEERWLRATASFGAMSLRHRKGGAYEMDDGILDIVKPGGKVSIERGRLDGFGHSAYSFTANGKTVISGGQAFLSAYDLDGGKLGDFVGHESDIWGVAPSPDGRYLVSGSADKTVRLWGLATRELLVTIFRGSDGEWVIWTPEGFYTSSPGGSRLVGWQINQGPDSAARYITAGQMRKALFRPDLVAAKILGDPGGLVRAAAARLNIDALLQTLLAPQVEIVSPAEGAQLDGGSVAITARVTDRGGGVGKIGFKLNGQTVGSADGASLAADGTVTQTFDLAAAATEIEIVAEDQSGNVQSLPARIAVRANPDAIASASDLYILAIGADLYQDERIRLSFAVKDASGLAEAFQAAGEGLYRSRPSVKTLFDGDVSVENIGAAFKDLSARVKATDVFVFYIAGHGKTMDGDFYFLPPSLNAYSESALKAQGYGPSKLWAWFEQIKAQKSIWIFDTCESGSAERLFRLRGLIEADAALKRMKDATGRAIFMASGEQQAAVEGYHNHGVFTYALMESLAKAGGGDRVQLYDIADFVQARVPQLGKELIGCGAGEPEGECQKPIVGMANIPNYSIARRYMRVLELLGDGSGVAPTR